VNLAKSIRERLFYLINMQSYSDQILTNGASPTQEALELRARRMAKQLDLRLRKFSPNERFSDTYGPYLLFDDRNAVVAYGFGTIEEVINFLAEKGAR
jgi:hypothetical protein